jgi:hypothetical protein
LVAILGAYHTASFHDRQVSRFIAFRTCCRLKVKRLQGLVVGMKPALVSAMRTTTLARVAMGAVHQLRGWARGAIADNDEIFGVVDQVCTVELGLVRAYGSAALALPDSAQGRREVREPAAASALWFSGAGEPARLGIVCDVSKGGVFLQPVGPLPAQCAVGQQLRVVFVTRKDGHEVKVDGLGAIRWIGAHPRHRCMGFGLELGTQMPSLAG